jgi:hypothetical protein
MIEPGIGHDILLISEYENTFSDLKKTFENNSDIMNFDLIKTVPIRYGEMKFYLTFFRMEVQPEAVDLKHDEAFEFNYPVKSVNLHFPEITSDGKTFEWVGPETETKIYVQLPVSKNDISLSICALKIQDEITTGLKVSINSVPIQIVTTSTVDCPVMIYGVVPTEAISRNHSEIELLLKTAYTISPAEAGTNPWDPRKVSLGLDWMRIER